MPFGNPSLVVLGPGDQSVELGNNPLTGAPEISLSTGASDEITPAKIGVSPASVPGDLYLNISGPAEADYAPGVPSMRLSTFAGPLPAGGRYINFFSDHLRTDQPLILNDTWSNITFSGTWTDAAGQRVQLLRDAAGTVHMRGIAMGGTPGLTVGSLPSADMWPTQTEEFSCKGGAGVGATVAFNVTQAGLVVVLTNLASATVRMPLTCSWSSL